MNTSNTSTKKTNTSRVISFGNFKGGTGKTTNSCMIAYSLSNLGYKTLLVDFDPQANATDLFTLTKKRHDKDFVRFEKTLMVALSEGSIKDALIEVKDNLDILASNEDFSNYGNFLEARFPNLDFYNRNRYFDNLLAEIKDDYDFIIIDNPPAISIYTNSSLISSDYAVVVLQTKERSLTGAEAFVDYVNEFVDQNNLNIEIAGVLPVLLKKDSIWDNSSYLQAIQSFGEENMFDSVINHMERLMKYDSVGIIDPLYEDRKDFDMHDIRVFKRYEDLTNEMLERIFYFED